MSLVDLPGYGYAKVPGAIKDHWVKTLPRYLQERNSLAGLVIVMDIRRPLTKLDTQMLDWSAPRQKPIHILLTKSDKLSKDKSLRALSDVKKIVQTQWADSFHTNFTVQLFSSLKKHFRHYSTKGARVLVYSGSSDTRVTGDNDQQADQLLDRQHPTQTTKLHGFGSPLQH